MQVFTTDAPCKLHVLGHDGHTLGVDGTQVGVLKEVDKVGLGCFLQCADSRRLEPKIALKVRGDLTHQALEGQLLDESVGALLELADLSQGHSARAVAVRLLDATSGRRLPLRKLGRALLRSHCREVLARCLATVGLAGSLLSASHGR